MNILMNIETAALIFIIIVVVFSCYINDLVFNCKIKLFTHLLKAAVRKFCLFVAISV